VSTGPAQPTKHLRLFAYVMAIPAPITAPLFAFALAREGDQANAVGVLVLAAVWTAAFLLFIV
jgi:RsiW-degrading membrane proteinase PrsW (M82 family)